MESLEGKAHLGTVGLRLDKKDGLHFQEDFGAPIIPGLIAGKINFKVKPIITWK